VQHIQDEQRPFVAKAADDVTIRAGRMMRREDALLLPLLMGLIFGGHITIIFSPNGLVKHAIYPIPTKK
jgi:hypothetical protein